ncbi:Myb-like DNA-binding domain containing protein [Trichomonas vaginalis G3]|uniref:Myb-like DNA-binding domain containing protein n=1 Tax=Trichomonas vaginalis (strain ATCC PRA-98 / G3) TaxID=412133 RepID=A2G7D0_TRIV3|nr:RNA polymerase II transcription regulator recruiting protein [Trichomonas vaginalis G3]EAX86936.1 Myb-like DNA-binding domain containing protein [Trichomonas vaginalis G3]KAI5510698.1 RNA polymerase II transcription regulator recruiting protein [Trichomonas vaginalis G3]|eukprot:XP_001299866.1 Myb-like DNA-binding domain containing protein [Trichomonas vaginalis G3]
MPIYQRFTPSEDKKLFNLVNTYGEQNWKVIAEKMNRTIRQVKERYTLFLSPKINSNIWTDEKDELLMKLAEKHYPHWMIISSYFDGRNDIQIKNRYKKLIKRKNRIQKQEAINTFEAKISVVPEEIFAAEFSYPDYNNVVINGQKKHVYSGLDWNITDDEIYGYFFDCNIFDCVDFWDKVSD